jgi:hypothetical protein
MALEEQIRRLREAQEIMSARMDRLDGFQARLARVALKLNRELGAQREKYPLG